MAGSPNGQYWDTCIFYAYLKGEKHRPGELEAIRSAVKRFDAGTLDILTSTITMIEVLAGKLDDNQRERFQQMTTRSNFTFVEVSYFVAKRASDIRDETAQFDDEGGLVLALGVPDAIHIASATAIDGVDSLVTLDSDDKKGKKELAMTGVAEHVEKVYGLVVDRPDVSGQVEMNYPDEREK